MAFEQKRLEELPDASGVYLMKDASGKVLYVGKATKLRSRIRSYFSEQRDGSRFQVPFLLEKLDRIETILLTTPCGRFGNQLEFQKF